MAQPLRALAALLEDSCSSPSPHRAAHAHLQVQFQGIWHPLLVSMAIVWTRCTDRHVGKRPIHTLKQTNKQKLPNAIQNATKYLARKSYEVVTLHHG